MNDAPDPPNGQSTQTFLLVGLTVAAIVVCAYILVRMD